MPPNSDLQILPLVLFTALGTVACDTADRAVAEPEQKPVTGAVTRQRNTMKIKLRLQDKTLTATLYDNPTAREFASLLPLTLTLQDYAKTEKISDLPKKLTTEGAPTGSDPSVGDIAYYAPWGNLALFYKDFGYSKGLIILGKVDSGTEALDVPGSMTVTIERADPE